MLIAYTCTFALAWWLGLYLISRNPQKPLLIRAGSGLIAYALALACSALAAYTNAAWLSQIYTMLLFLPALCWAGALACLLPMEKELFHRANGIWQRAMLPISLGMILVGGLSGIVVIHPQGNPPPNPLVWVLVALVGLPLVAGFSSIAWNWRKQRPDAAIGIIAIVTIFFGLGMALLIFPLGGQVPPWAILAIGFDLGILGLAIAFLDALDEGETLRPDMARSLIAAGMSAFAFGSLIAFAMIAGIAANPPMVGLLFGVIALAIAAPTLDGHIQAILDRLAFAEAPALQRARADLRETASSLPKVDLGIALAEISEAEFTRLTRRALSQYSDLGKLSTNPLIQLPLVSTRLAARGALNQPLERAAELKAILAESTARLKPRDGNEFGTNDAWRYYNAIYFPYIIGLRPYSRRYSQDTLDPISQKALEWFASQVPERTLHNWQNNAASIIAGDLRAGMR